MDPGTTQASRGLGAGPAWARRPLGTRLLGPLGSSADLLPRIRTLFLILALVNLASFALPPALQGLPAFSPRLLLLVAAIVLGGTWITTYRKGTVHPAYDMVEGVALFIVVWAAPNPAQALSVLYLGLSFRSLYGSRARAISGMAVYIAAFIAAATPDPFAIDAARILQAVPGLAISGAVMHLLATADTLRSHATRQLEESEARSGAILDSALDCVVIADCQGRIVDFNPSAERVFGYVRSEVLGAGVSETLIPPALRDAHRKGMVRFLTTGQRTVLGSRIETTAMRADGSEFPVELALTMVRQDDTPLFVAYLRDITDRRREEERLQGAEQKYRRLVEGLPSIVYTAEFGEDGRWSYVSPQIETVLGYTPEEWLADPGMWFSQVHPEDRGRVLDQESLSQSHNSEFVSEYRMLHRDGRIVWFRDRAKIIADGERAILQGVMLNITQEKQLEERLAQSQEGEAVGWLAGDREPETEAGPGAKTILIAEEEPVRDTIVGILRQAGYVVLAARSGREALELVRRRKHPVDLLLTDVVMPELSGKELSGRIAALQSDLKTIYMSAYPDQMTANQGVLSEGEWFLYKPFTTERLLSKVRQALRGS